MNSPYETESPTYAKTMCLVEYYEELAGAIEDLLTDINYEIEACEDCFRSLETDDITSAPIPYIFSTRLIALAKRFDELEERKYFK